MSAFKTIYKYLAKYKFRLFLGILALVIVDIAHLYIPRITKYAIDDITAGNITRPDLVHYALTIVGLALFISILRFFWRYYIIGTSRKIEEQLRNQLFGHLQTLDMKFFNNYKIGDLMAHATNDINAIRETCGHGMIQFLDIVVWGPFSLLFMLLISVKLTLFAIIPLPFVSLVVLRFVKLIYNRFKNVQESFSNLTSVAQENIEGIRVIKVYNQEYGEINNFREKSQDYMDKTMRLVKVQSMFSPLIFFLTSVSGGIVLWVGGAQVMSHSISLGDLVAFMAYLSTFIWPIIAVGILIDTIQRGSASMGRINKLLDTMPEIKVLPDKRTENINALECKKIEINNVDFSYNDTPILEKINLTLDAGDSLGITGKIGTGKTTLMNLLLRLYDPTNGEITFDDIPLKNIPFNTLRKTISFVPQESFLFSDTIKANIAFGCSSAADEEIQKIAKLTMIHDEIMSFPKNYDGVIGERGVTLSSGQCQRIALARALMVNPGVLIIDNALASVDIEKETEILYNLKERFKDKILIIVSHRIRSITGMDKIMVMENNKISEIGTHEELLNIKGTYYNIFRYQEFEE